MTVTEGVENTIETSLMEAVVGEKMVQQILTSLGPAGEHFLLAIEDHSPVILSVVNVQGKTRTFQSGPWTMTLLEEQPAEHLIRQVTIF